MAIFEGGRRVAALALAAVSSVAWGADVQVSAVPKPVMRPYTVNPGDELEVYVWGEERLQRVIRVLPDGTFSYPLVGKVIAAGQLPTQIEAQISKGLEGQYRGQVPQVTVSVRMPSGMQFSVVGRVKTPGIYSPGRYVNLLEALSFSGGPDQFANLDNVSIIRKSGNGLVSIRVRIAATFKSGQAGHDIDVNSIPQIESGDTVVVP